MSVPSSRLVSILPLIVSCLRPNPDISPILLPHSARRTRVLASFSPGSSCSLPLSLLYLGRSFLPIPPPLFRGISLRYELTLILVHCVCTMVIYITPLIEECSFAGEEAAIVIDLESEALARRHVQSWSRQG